MVDFEVGGFHACWTAEEEGPVSEVISMSLRAIKLLEVEPTYRKLHMPKESFGGFEFLVRGGRRVWCLNEDYIIINVGEFDFL